MRYTKQERAKKRGQRDDVVNQAVIRRQATATQIVDKVFLEEFKNVGKDYSLLCMIDVHISRFADKVHGGVLQKRFKFITRR